MNQTKSLQRSPDSFSKKKGLEDQIHNLEHLLKVVLKNQEQIKVHLWKQPQKRLEIHEVDDFLIKQQEQEAVNYIRNVLIPDLAIKEAEKGDMVAQSAWIEWAAKPIIEYLKTQALIYIGKALEELKNQMLPVAVDIADWVLEQLENIVLKQYETANNKQKEIFKNKIQEKFPNSRLLEKLT